VGFTYLIVSLLCGIKSLGREANNSHSSTDVNAWTYTATAPYLFMAQHCYASTTSPVYLEAWLMLQ
jgi:hypothetical protein